MLQIDKELKKIFTEDIVFNDAKKHLQSFVKSSDNLVLIYDDIGEKELDTLGGLGDITLKIEAIVYQYNVLLGYSTVRVYLSLGDCFVDKATGTVSSKLGNLILYYSMESVSEGEIFAYSSDLIYQYL
ncbi:hypothetical protein [Acinetobacter seifertii]|uniref:hypothetical protein n=1 Tax=Acinetobacter seifertii TaxID=1530123 RepID=UPI000C1F11F7|nr:hypothetical protein [Acinetobacter seifertii]PJF02103.1 hypothetical protein CVD06_19155 [Acinetobacter seifertii]PJG72043.1 hypothetical protein CVD08_01265 [Acinetobacter seifertii]